MRISFVFFLIAAAVCWAADAVPVTACSALTQDQVQRALGRSVGKGVEANGAGQSICDFRSNTGLVSVAVHTLDRQASPEAQQADLKIAFPAAAFQAAQVGPAKGIVMLLPESGVQLHVAVGRKYRMVTVLGFGSTAEVRSAAEAIARTMLARLGSV